MAFRNKRVVPCSICQQVVELGKGWTEGPPWVTKCDPCSGRVDTKEARARVKVTQKGNYAIFQPVGYLGGEKFDLYRKSIEGTRFNGADRVNEATLEKTSKMIEALKASDFAVEVEPTLAASLQAVNAQIILSVQGAAKRATKVDEALKAKGLALFPFQKQGVEWLASRHGALLADQMGLGKTIQALISVPEGVPVVVVSPSVAKGVWKREAAKWRPDLKITVLSGRGSFRWPEPGELIAINYDVLPSVESVAGQPPEGCVLIADEGQYLKNPKAARTVKFRYLSELVRGVGGRTWILTATPLENRPPELWSVLQAANLATEAFGNWSNFVRLCDGVQKQFGGYDWGTPSPEVAERLRRVSLRRVRKDVLPQLPGKTYQDILVDIDPKTAKICDAVLADIEQAQNDRKRGNALNDTDAVLDVFAQFFTPTTTEADRISLRDRIAAAIESSEQVRNTLVGFKKMSRARQALAVAKIPALLELVEGFEEQEEPVVVFSMHLEPIKALGAREGWGMIIGGETSPEQRTQIEDDFQAGKLKGIAATIGAGGVAITLTRSHYAIFVDRAWNPAQNDQAEDRICRIGQTHGCIIMTLTADHAIDQRVNELLAVKRGIIQAAIEQSAVTDVKVPGLVEVDFEALAAEAKAEAEAQDRAKAEALKLAEERAKQFANERERIEHEKKERAEREAKEKKEQKARARAKARGWVEETDHPERREAVSPQEQWALQALQSLSAADPDRAFALNGVGFNKGDSYIGHWLTMELTMGLTPKQWQLAIALCRKYHGQVGECP